MPTKIADLNPKPFIRVDDLDGPTNLTVIGWGMQKVWNVRTNSEEEKPALYFYNEKKFLILNATNLKTLRVLCGKFIEDAIGKTITLTVGERRKTETVLIADKLPPQETYTLDRAITEANAEIGPDADGLLFYCDAEQFKAVLKSKGINKLPGMKDVQGWREKIIAVAVAWGREAKPGQAVPGPWPVPSAQPQEPAHPTEEALDDQPPTDQPAEAHADALPVAA